MAHWTLLCVLVVPLLPSAWVLLTADKSYNDIPDIPLSFVSSLLAFGLTAVLIPSIAEANHRAGLSGYDINKKGTPGGKDKIPEALGIVTGTVYLICVICFQIHYHSGPRAAAKLVEYNAALASMCFILFLGFADDVLDLRWRYKLVIPAVAALPLLVAYSGPTEVILPKLVHAVIGKTVELGVLYKVYMLLVAVFCTNSINILAGINGLECGQAYVIGSAVLFHNLVHVHEPDTHDAHRLSVVLLLPFLAVSAALLLSNWYPSRVFVGDTYTYFAGMTFAVVGILGHFSKTLLLFFLPQILNFLISIPQLARIVPCPRHRLPRHNMATGKLEGIATNLNLVNVTLRVTGPLHERTLCVVLLAFQAACCALAFVIRYPLASLLYA